jgi:membrane-associated phospholipid phosphatase
MRDEQPARNGCPFGRAGWVSLILSGVVATVASYLLLDKPVSGWFLEHPNQWHQNAWVDSFRQLGKAYVPIWLLAIWSCLTDRWRPTIVTIVAMILVGLCVCPLKAMVQRARPGDALIAVAGSSSPAESLSWRRKVSFPSGDTAVVFAAAATLSLYWGRLWTPGLFGVAAAIGLLRITALAHYPSDVAAGTLIGVLSGCGAMWGMARWWALTEVHIRRQWRLIVLLVLVLVIPFASPFIGMRSLQIFLRAYAIPLSILAPIYLAGAWLLGRLRGPNAMRGIDRSLPTTSVSEVGRQPPSEPVDRSDQALRASDSGSVRRT